MMNDIIARLLDAMKSGNKDVVLYCLNDPEYQIDLFKAALKNLSETQPNDDIFNYLISALQNNTQSFRNEILCDKEVKDALIEYFRSILQSVDQSKIKKVISILECTELDASVTESILLSLAKCRDDRKIEFLTSSINALINIIHHNPAQFIDFLRTIEDQDALGLLTYGAPLDLTLMDIIFLIHADSQIFEDMKKLNLRHSRPLYGSFADDDRKFIKTKDGYNVTPSNSNITELIPVSLSNGFIGICETKVMHDRLKTVLTGGLLSAEELIELYLSNMPELKDKYSRDFAMYTRGSTRALSVALTTREYDFKKLTDQQLTDLFRYSTNGLDLALTQNILQAHPDKAETLLSSLIGTGTLHIIVETAHFDLLKLLLESLPDLKSQLVNNKYEDTPLLIQAVSALQPREGEGGPERPDKYDGKIRKQTLEICRYLLDNGADIESVDKYGNTALHIVTKLCNKDIANALVDAGKKLKEPYKFFNAKNANGETAFDMLWNMWFNWNSKLKYRSGFHAMFYGYRIFYLEGEIEYYSFNNDADSLLLNHRDDPAEIRTILKEAGCKASTKTIIIDNFQTIDAVFGNKSTYYALCFTTTALCGMAAVLWYDLLLRNGAMTSAIIGNIGNICSKFFESSDHLIQSSPISK